MLRVLYSDHFWKNGVTDCCQTALFRVISRQPTGCIAEWAPSGHRSARVYHSGPTGQNSRPMSFMPLRALYGLIQFCEKGKPAHASVETRREKGTHGAAATPTGRQPPLAARRPLNAAGQLVCRGAALARPPRSDGYDCGPDTFLTTTTDMSVKTASAEMHAPTRTLETAGDAAGHATAGALPQRPSNKRTRVEAFDDEATQRLFEQLQHHVHQCLAVRARKDEEQRAVSRRIAAAHPLTFPAGGTEAAARPRAVSPYTTAANASPPEEAASRPCKDTPCLVPTPVCSTPQTRVKADEHSRGAGGRPFEPPALSI